MVQAMTFLRRKNLVALVFASWTLLGECAVWKDPATGIEWTYEKNGKSVIIESGSAYRAAIPTAASGAISIPVAIDGCAVVGIGAYAFRGNFKNSFSDFIINVILMLVGSYAIGVIANYLLFNDGLSFTSSRVLSTSLYVAVPLRGKPVGINDFSNFIFFVGKK